MVSPDGVAPSRIVCVSASVNLPLHHKVQKFSSGSGSPVWSRKKGCKTVVVVVWCGVCLWTIFVWDSVYLAKKFPAGVSEICGEHLVAISSA